jgi:hypothetical protein
VFQRSLLTPSSAWKKSEDGFNTLLCNPAKYLQVYKFSHPRREMLIFADMRIPNLAFAFIPHELSMNNINVSSIIDGVTERAD